MRVHACFLDKDCCPRGRLWRLHVGRFAVAFTPGSRFTQRYDKATQRWVDSDRHDLWGFIHLGY